LTKPDTLGAGATSSRLKWKDLLEGRVEAHALKNGYYSVRLPDDRERTENLTRSESQARAAHFFDTNAPWNEIADRGRFGVPALIADISQLLLRLIESSIPKLKLDVDRLLAECLKDLGALPAPPKLDPTTDIILMITAFCDDFKGAVYADGIKSLAQQNRTRYLSFKRDIRATAPDFRPFVGHMNYARPADPGHESDCISAWNPKVKPLDLCDVKKVIADSIGWELPHNVPFEAKKVLIEQFTNLWTSPALSCFNDVFNNLSNIVQSLGTKHFARFKQLESHIASVTRQEISVCQESTRLAIRKTLELERVPLFTQNIHYFDSARNKWLSHYKWVYRAQYRYHLDQDEYLPSRPPTPPTPPQGWNTEFEEEFVVMADVRAYFQVAYKRIIDYLPLTIEHELNQAMVSKLQTALVESVIKNGSDEWRKGLLGEDPVISAKRRKFEGTKQRLVDIKQRLADYERDVHLGV